MQIVKETCKMVVRSRFPVWPRPEERMFLRDVKLKMMDCIDMDVISSLYNSLFTGIFFGLMHHLPVKYAVKSQITVIHRHGFKLISFVLYQLS